MEATLTKSDVKTALSKRAKLLKNIAKPSAARSDTGEGKPSLTAPNTGEALSKRAWLLSKNKLPTAAKPQADKESSEQAKLWTDDDGPERKLSVAKKVLPVRKTSLLKTAKPERRRLRMSIGESKVAELQTDMAKPT